jgi:hypothetical protein
MLYSFVENSVSFVSFRLFCFVCFVSFRLFCFVCFTFVLFRLFHVWFGLVWFGLVWFGLVWFGLVWFGLVWFVYSEMSLQIIKLQ